MKKITVILLILVLLLIIFTVYTQTAHFRSLILNILLNQANKQLNAELVIDRIEGNIFSNLSLVGISISQKDDILVQADELSISYNLVSLINKHILINKFELDNLSVFLIEEQDGWNFEKLLPDNVLEDTEQEKGVVFDWQLSIKSFSLKNANIEISYYSTNETKSLPSSINDFNLDLSFSYKNEQVELNLDNISFTSDWYNEHQVAVNKISFELIHQKNISSLKNLVIATDNTLIKADIDYHNDFNVDMVIDFFNLKDFHYFIPDVDDSRNITVQFVAEGKEDIITAVLSVLDTRKKIVTSNLSIANYSNIAELKYSLDITFNQLEPLSYVNNFDISPIIDGIIELKGNTFDYREGNIKLTTDIVVSDINQAFLSEDDSLRFRLEADMNDGKLISSITTDIGEAGVLNFDVSIDDIEPLQNGDVFATPFRVNGDIQNLNLDPMLPDFTGNLVFSVVNQANRPIMAEIVIDPSSFAGLDIGSSYIHTSITKEKIQIDRFQLLIADNSIEMSGTIDSLTYFDINYIVNLPNISEVVSTFTEFDLKTKGLLEGSIKGEPDSIQISGIINLSDIMYENYLCASLNIEHDATVKNGEFASELVLNAGKITIDEFEIDDILLEGIVGSKYNNILLELSQRDNSIKTNLELIVEDSSHIALNIDLFAQIGELIWKSGEKAARIVYADNSVNIENFILQSDNQTISANGIVYFDDQKENDFSFNISSLDLKTIGYLTNNKLIEDGYLSIQSKLEGYSSTPTIKVDVNVNDLSLDQIKGLNISGTFAYPSLTGDWISKGYYPPKESFIGTIDFNELDNHLVKIAFFMPVQLSFNNGLKVLESEKSYFSLTTAPIDIDFLDGTIEGISNLSGSFLADIYIYHSLEALTEITKSFRDEDYSKIQIYNDGTVSGKIQLQNSNITIDDLGVRFRNIDVELNAENDKINITRLHVSSGQGNLSAKGYVQPLKDNYPVSLDLESSNFTAVNNDMLEVVLNTAISLSGFLNELRFNGNITLPKVRVNLDNMIQDNYISTSKTPLLIHARESKEKEKETESTHFINQELTPLVNSRGRITVSAPRNIWIRSSDMNIELKTDLEIVKRDVFFEIFGSINTIRGFYAFYGKRFQIEQGDITFTGGREINPQLSLIAVYNFRGIDLRRNELKLIVTGSLEEMDISFELNNQHLDEADAVSYILFGRSFDELTQGEKSEASNQALAIGGILANRLADVMTGAVGETLRLDVIEFRSDTVTSQIGLEVGKYLTENLFVSFKKDFNLSNSKEPVTEEVIIEYEIKPFLYLQGRKSDDRTTGMDLIWRFRR